MGFRCLIVAAPLVLACSRAPEQDADGLRLVTPEGHTAPIRSAVFSRDGRFIVTAADDGTARIWESATGREVRRFGDDTAWVRGAALSPDAKLVAIARDSVARVWDTETGREVRSLRGHGGPLTSVTFSPDGGRVLTTSFDNTARIWSSASGDLARVLRGHGARVTAGSFSPDGRFVVTASFDSTARVWNAATGAVFDVLRGHSGWVTSAAFSPAGRLVATASQDNTVRLWAVDDRGRWSTRSTLPHPRVLSAAFSADGRMLVTAGDDGWARVWETSSMRLVAQMEARTRDGLPAALTSAAFSPDARLVITAGRDTSVRVWNAANGDSLRRLVRHAYPVRAVSFSADGRYIASATADTAARVWEVATGDELVRAGAHESAVRSAVFSPDGRLLLTASDDGRAQLMNATTGAPTAAIAHGAELLSSEFAPDGRTFVTASRDSTARVWSAPDGRAVAVLAGHTDWVTAATYSPDGGYIATASRDSTVRLWDPATGSELRRFGGGHRDVVWSARFSSDGRRLVTASDDTTALIWDVATQRAVRRLRGHSGFVRSARFSADGRFIVTGSNDRTARVWDAATGRLIRRLDGHAGWVTSAVFSPDGRFIVTASTDGTTRVWKADTGAELFRRFALDSADWVLVAPDGRFDGSEGGIRRLHYARGLRTVALESFFNRFYTPGLAGLLISGAPYDGPDIRRGYRSPPTVRIVSPMPSSKHGRTVQVVIEVTETGGGFQNLRLYHNGALIAGDSVPPVAGRRGRKDAARARGFQPKTDVCPATACFEVDVELLAGMNTLEATAFASDETETERDEVTLVLDAAQPTAVLHVLAVGINTYGNPRYNLNYGRDDAATLARWLDSPSQRSIFADVNVDTLFDAKATGANIRRAFARMADSIRPQDVFVFFYAGHGTTEPVRGAAGFFLVPSDVQRATDAAELSTRAVSGDQLRALLEGISARKKIMIVDACQSGGLIGGFTRRGAAEERAIAQLARSSGVFVMSSTDSEQFAREVGTLGHGILTYSLLSALEGPAADTTGYRMVRQVMGEAERVTREVSAWLGAEPQYPMVHANGMDFPIAMVPRGAKRTVRDVASLFAEGTAAPTPAAAPACSCAVDIATGAPRRP